MNIPNNVGQPFSLQDDVVIRSLHVQGVSAADIGVKLGRTEAGVTARLERLGLKASRVVQAQAKFFGCTVEQIKAQHSKNAAALSGMAKKARKTGRKVNGYTALQLDDHVAATLERAGL